MSGLLAALPAGLSAGLPAVLPIETLRARCSSLSFKALRLGIESGLCCLACSRCCGLLALSFSSGLWALSNGAQLSFWFWSLGYVFDP